MKISYIVIGIIGLVLIGGGAYMLSSQGEVAAPDVGEQHMMDDGTVMPGGGETMDDAAMGSGHMMEDGTMMSGDASAMNPAAPVMKPGRYEPFAPEKIAQASKGPVVLFFRASWCPECKATDADIRKNVSKIPTGTVILDVDYDNSEDLKKKYGVTYQHTFVQVDASGKMVTKWSSSPTLEKLISNIKK